MVSPANSPQFARRTECGVDCLWWVLHRRDFLQPSRCFRRSYTYAMRLLRFGLLLGLVCGCHPQVPTFSSDPKVVTLLASVRDRDGAIVKELSKEDFRLEEDGHRQTIRYFSRESDLPLVIGLLVDTSRSMQTVFEPERLASNRFLEQVLREDRDLAAVIHFDVRVGVLQGFTSSREKLAEALERLEIPPRPATLLYDAIRRSSENLMRKQSGRKSFTLLSDGMDFRSVNTIGTAIEFAQRADTMIYSILFAHPAGLNRLNLPGKGIAIAVAQKRNQNRGRIVMERLARETGGGFFEVTKEKSIEQIYAQIEDELRSQYSIGFTPDRKDGNGKYRKLKLTAVRKGLVIRTRDGYYPN
jgi:VWFA-related protein